jgi:hypothetical protein
MPPISPPIHPERCGPDRWNDDGGTAWRLGDDGLDPGLSGAEKLREPRLPLDRLPPARAHASKVHKHVPSNIVASAVNSTERLIALSSSIFLDMPHIAIASRR